MSHTSKIKDPKNNPAPTLVDPGLPPDKDTLISEFKKLDSMLAAINQNIGSQNEIIVKANQDVEQAQQNIATLRTQGLQIVGQANVLTRILRTMDVNTDEFTMKPPQVTEPTEVPPPSMPAELEETPAPKRGLKNRFSPR